jgi:hypothetical protein
MPCFFKSIFTFAFGQREKLPFSGFFFALLSGYYSVLSANQITTLLPEKTNKVHASAKS